METLQLQEAGPTTASHGATQTITWAFPPTIDGPSWKFPGPPLVGTGADVYSVIQYLGNQLASGISNALLLEVPLVDDGTLPANTPLNITVALKVGGIAVDSTSLNICHDGFGCFTAKLYYQSLVHLDKITVDITNNDSTYGCLTCSPYSRIYCHDFSLTGDRYTH